jgi:hypothetical protein
MTTVFASLAVIRWVEERTVWSIRKFVRIACRYRTIPIQASAQTITAADPYSDDPRGALDRICRRPGTHQIGPTQEMTPRWDIHYHDLRRKNIAKDDWEGS